jgi:hypothetical protein
VVHLEVAQVEPVAQVAAVQETGNNRVIINSKIRNRFRIFF